MTANSSGRTTGPSSRRRNHPAAAATTTAAAVRTAGGSRHGAGRLRRQLLLDLLAVVGPGEPRQVRPHPVVAPVEQLHRPLLERRQLLRQPQGADVDHERQPGDDDDQ